MTTRIKAKNTAYQSQAELEQAIDKAAELQLKMDREIAEYNEEKSTQDKAFKARIKTAKAKINEIVIAAQAYVDHHRDATLGDKQTAETRLAFYGYRKSPGVVKTLNTRWTFAKALNALKDAGQTACIKVTESLNKQAVKAQIPEPEMAQYGLRVDYPEEFGIEPKRAEETPDKKITSA